MANNNTDLDPGFDEVHLDPGFEEVPAPANGWSPLAKRLGSNIAALPGKAFHALYNTDLGKGLSQTGSNLATTAGVGSAGAAEGATSLAGGLSGIGATGMSALDTAKGVVQGKGLNILPTPENLAAKNTEDLPLSLKFQAYKKMIKDKQDEIAAKSPLADTGGQIMGNLAVTPFLPEFGGGKLASMVGKIGPGMDQFLAGQAESATGKILGKAASGAIRGAPIGAAMGASGSNASNPEDFA